MIAEVENKMLPTCLIKRAYSDTKLSNVSYRKTFDKTKEVGFKKKTELSHTSCAKLLNKAAKEIWIHFKY